MKYFRSERVSDLMMEELNKIILREVEIPEALITITDIEVQKDLSQAIVKISVYPSSKYDEVLKILQRNQSHFQYLLVRKMNIRPIPKISFQIDHGPEKAAIIEKKLLDQE